MATIARAFLVVAVILLSTASAWAQPKTDVVILTNGDRITGEVKGLSRGRLQLSTDDAGTIDFEWDKVATIQAAGMFELATSDGRRLVGSIGPPTPRTVVLVAGDGTTLLPMAEVTLLDPIGTRFWKRLDGSIDAGFSYTRSSGVAQVTLSSETEFRRPGFLFRLTGDATLTERSDQTERDDRADLNFSYVRYRWPRWFVAGSGRLETNESLGLELRTQVGGLIGRRMVNTNHAQFEVGSGIVGNEEHGVDTAPTQNIEALFVMRTSYYAYDRPKTSADASVQYYPSLSSWGRQRLQIDGNLKRELVKDFFFAIDGFVTFDSEPPNPEASRIDVGLVTSIGWSF